MNFEKKLSAGSGRASGGVAFLLTQVGAQAARRFGERVAELGISAPDVGIMRKIAADPGVSQQALAEHLGILPSRMVVLVDGLEKKGLAERRASDEDRRAYSLYLTGKGEKLMEQVGKAAREHEQKMCAGLDEKEREVLRGLLERIAEREGLKAGVHPGYRDLGKREG